jgi:peptide/nickel transport system permease protein
MGMSGKRHLFGLKDSERQFFVLGSDALGRDLLSRILYGAQFSLSIGLVGIVTTVAFGVLIGAVAGYFGGWVDRLLMRGADLFLSFPTLFAILGIRAVFPGQLSVAALYWLIVLIFTVVGWASIARVIRGQVLSLKDRDYVRASRVAGASDWWILTRHVLPFTSSYLVVQISILVPAFILGEVVLSFLGVGVQEPDASWGTLLVDATSIRTLTVHTWLLSPAAFIFLTVLAFNVIGDEWKALERRRQILF